MANPPDEPQEKKETAHLLLRISIKTTETSQEPETGRDLSRRRSGRQKTMSRKGKKNSKKAKHHRPRRSKKSTSSALRGVRKRQRRLQKKRVSFNIDKQPLSPFFLFMAKHRHKLQRSNPQLTVVEMAKMLGKMWHQQPQSDKEMYKEQAKYLRRRKQQRRE